MEIQKTNEEIAKTLNFIHNTEHGIKPLIEDIFLIKTHVAGLYYYVNMTSFKNEIALGDYLELFREPDNEHDKNAIVINHKNEKIGYIPRKHNIVLANLMDAGKQLYAKVSRRGIDQYDYLTISYDVFLKEF